MLRKNILHILLVLLLPLLLTGCSSSSDPEPPDSAPQTTGSVSIKGTANQ